MSAPTKTRLSLALLLSLPLALAGTTAHATPSADLVELPAEKLQAMEPMLRGGDLALIESKPDGRMKQVSVITLVAAPASIVRDLLTTPEKWSEFVPNARKAKVVRQPDGTANFEFEVDLKVVTLSARYRLSVLPDGAVELLDTGPSDRGVQRFRLVEVKGGTIVVNYGYMDLDRANGFLRRLIREAAPLEHGFTLAAELAFLRTMKTRAEKLAPSGSFPPAVPTAKGPGFNFLLARGRVAVVRSAPNGRLADISLLENVRAPLQRVADVIQKVGDYAQVIAGVSKCTEAKRTPDTIEFDMTFHLSVLSFTSRYLMHREPSAIDVVATGGDLRGAHERWDLSPRGKDGTLAVYRSNQDLYAASPLVLGMVFRAMPLLEHGVGVALALCSVTGIRARAESL